MKSISLTSQKCQPNSLKPLSILSQENDENICTNSQATLKTCTVNNLGWNHQDSWNSQLSKLFEMWPQLYNCKQYDISIQTANLNTNAFFNFVIHTADVRVIHHSCRKWLRLSPVSPERQKEHDNQIDHTWRNQNIHQSFSTLTTLKNLKTRHQHPKLSNSLKRQNYPMVENPTIRICSSTTCVNSIAKKRLT